MKKTAFISSIEKDGESFVRAFWTRGEAVEEKEYIASICWRF